MVKYIVEEPRKKEVPKMAKIIMNSLMVPEKEQKYLSELFDLLGKENLRVLRSGKEVIGGLGIIPMGHHFGGKSVPCAGVTLLGIAPQWRGGGAASEMMKKTVKELNFLRYPLSSLHAATESLYRKSGYERSIPRYIYEIELRNINIRDRKSEMVKVKKKTFKPFKETYDYYIKNLNGPLDRHSSIWEWRHNPRGKTAHKYLVKNRNKVEGYVAYFQERKGREATLWLLDYCALTESAGRRILTFLADHGTMAQKVSWAGGPNDILLELLPEKKYNVVLASEVMLRILSAPEALKSRGYSKILNTAVHIEISDELIDSNNGNYILTISNGKASVTKGGDGLAKLDIKALAQLYAGRFSPHELSNLGRLEAKEEELEKLAVIFAGPAPWLADMF